MDNYSILFVDDQPNILTAYKLLSHKDKSDRTYYFATDGAEAIEILWNNRIDVLITDYNMPILDGLKLTEYVEAHFPATVRVIVSGCLDYELFVDTMKHAHRFMSKPASLKELVGLLEGVSFIHSIINDKSIEKELLKITILPTLPDVYTKVCNAMEDEENYSLKKVGEIVSEDIGMSSNILKFINSTYFSFDDSVTRIDQAVSLLGGDIIKMLILRETISRFVSSNEKEFVERIFTHSSIVAKLVREIMIYEKSTKEETNLAYTIAFLHDIGRLILFHSFKEKYSAVEKELYEKKGYIEEVETSHIGICHSKIAAYLFSLWGLPITIISPILNHHRINILDGNNPLILAALHVADNLEYMHLGSDLQIKQNRINKKLIHSLGFDEHLSQWEEIAKELFNSL